MSPTAFRLCVVIPTFNNATTVGRVAKQALAAVGSVIVVNDGSGAEGRHAVEALRALDGVVIVHRENNGGKGRAVKDGFRRAAELGFTHALQIDADGQHALDDMQRFVGQARENPEALVLGAPTFDESVPKLRLHARQITTFFCALETLGKVIVDPMCGFRVYPLKAALAAGARGDHMDFDPEIAVKMVWSGVPVVNLMTRVRYLSAAEGGVSNFRMLRDNLRISWMHTRLVFGACLRLLLRPLGLMRPGLERKVPWYRVRESGNATGIRLLASLARALGRAPVRFLLLFIVLYYSLLRPAARGASRDYLQRIGAASGFWAVYQHLLCFAECALDRLYFLSGDLQRFQVRRDGHVHLAELAERKQGAILLGAHVGSFEAARALERSSDDVSIYTLGYFDNARMLNRELDRAGDNSNRQFISLQPGELQHLFRVKELIEGGHLVAMLGDRSTGGQSVEVDFLGSRARFPIGPYAMAAALQCPILLTIGLYFSPNSYEVYCEPFMARVPKRREDPEAFAKCAQAFAERLEHYCRRAPNNWFNFYDFWDEHGAS